MDLILSKKNLVLLIGILIAIFIGFRVMSLPPDVAIPGRGTNEVDLPVAKKSN